MMTEHPILLPGPMVCAILEGRKTQTRQIMRPQPEGDPAKRWPDPNRWQWSCSKGRTMLGIGEAPCSCPFGYKGDRLWVRETWGMSYVDLAHDRPHVVGGHWGSPARPGRACAVVFKADGPMPVDVDETARWSSPLHMPRWASRITLRVTDVRVQRLQEISEEDAMAEGLHWWSKDGQLRKWGLGRHRSGELDFVEEWADMAHSHAEAFGRLWNSLNKRAPWASNPWVWAISFERMP